MNTRRIEPTAPKNEGMLTAMDTLCSQAFGASQTSKMGTYSLTGIAVISFMFLFSSVLMWNTSSILIALGQPVAVSYMAGDFIRDLMLGVPFLCIYELIQKVSQSRNETRPMLISTLMCNIINLGLGYYLVNWTNRGWKGAAVAHAVGEFVKVPTVLLCMAIIGLGGDSGESDDTSDYSTKCNPQDTQHYLEVDSGADDEDESEEDDIEFLHHIWEGFVISEALSPSAIIEFLRIGVPGMLQVMFEWWVKLCRIFVSKKIIASLFQQFSFSDSHKKGRIRGHCSLVWNFTWSRSNSRNRCQQHHHERVFHNVYALSGHSGFR